MGGPLPEPSAQLQAVDVWHDPIGDHHFDRLVALLAGEENIREVIAFPKTQKGADPLTGAPSPLDAAQLTELGLTVKPRPMTKQ